MATITQYSGSEPSLQIAIIIVLKKKKIAPDPARLGAVILS